MKISVGDYTSLKDALYFVRNEVFVKEQHIDKDLEFDEYDKECVHFVIEHDNKPIGVARLKKDGQIGRLCVIKEWRNKGIGMALLHQCVLKAKDLGLLKVYLNAQHKAQDLYKQFGFNSLGNTFLEAGIEHIKMDRDVNCPFFELVFEVDDKNNILKIVKRSTMRKLELAHRSSYIVVANSDDKFLIEIRTLNKDYCPGKFDCCVGGVQQIFEDQFTSASRELFEEVGIKATKDTLHFLGTKKIDSYPTFVMADLYFIRGNFITCRQESEVSGVMFLNYDEIIKLKDNIAKDSLKAFLSIIDEAKKKGLL